MSRCGAKSDQMNGRVEEPIPLKRAAKLFELKEQFFSS
jgi:hypothetical protein